MKSYFMIRRWLSIVLVMSCIIPLPSMAGEKVDKTVETKANGIVAISNVRGKIEVMSWDKAKVRVKGELDDLTEKFTFKEEGGRVEVAVKLPDNSSTKSGKGSNLSIWVPRESKLVFDGVATDLKIQGIAGKLDINSVSGDLEIDAAGTQTFINSVSGDIQLNQSQGKVDISTVSGDATLTLGDVELQCSGVSADIDAKAGKLGTSKLGTVSGDINLYGQLDKDATLVMGTVSGDAYFFTDKSLSASVSMETAPGGDIINELSSDQPESSFIGSESVSFTLGNGDASIKMSTVSGDIGLKKN